MAEIRCEFMTIGKIRGGVYEEQGAPIIWEVYDTSKKTLLALGFSKDREAAKKAVSKEVPKHLAPHRCEE